LPIFAKDRPGNTIGRAVKAGVRMTVQTVELCGERYVILPEREFLEMRKQIPAENQSASEATSGGFREVVPLQVGGVPTSEMLIQDRR
jgi:hypothetical protein